MTWQIDSVHSQASFAVRHMMVSTVKGLFTRLSGTLEIDEQHPERSWVEAAVEVESIDTHEPQRDAHLRSPDFFDVARFPMITFKSTRVEAVGDQQYRITGDLTMHGVTKEVMFTTVYNGQQNDMRGGRRTGLNARTTINRKDFDLGWNQVIEAGGVAVGEMVKLEIDLEALQMATTPDVTPTLAKSE